MGWGVVRLWRCGARESGRASVKSEAYAPELSRVCRTAGHVSRAAESERGRMRGAEGAAEGSG